MAEIAGVVLGVVALWNACVQAFDVVDSSRKYGLDYELLRTRLEVEKFRLDKWGVAIGLRDADDNSTELSPDSPLFTDRASGLVRQLLGHIQHIFDNSDRLQSTYGLKRSEEDSAAVDQPRLFLATIFKKPYAKLQRDARERQRSANIGRRTLWAISDKSKFQVLVADVKGLIDSLENLFPGSKSKIAEDLRQDILHSADVAELQLLQDAMADDDDMLSQYASARLEDLRAPAMSARTALLTVADDDRTTRPDGAESDGGRTTGPEDSETDDEESQDSDETDDDISKRQAQSPLRNVKSELKEVQRFFGKKHGGALDFILFGPFPDSTQVTARCRWRNEERSWPRAVGDYGPLRSGHAAFGKSIRSPYN